MARVLALLNIALLTAAIAVAASLGVFVGIDESVVGWRFAASNRPASGDVVFVEIDGKSLQQVGVWPWPRRVDAELLDRLMALGASDVVFDVDFSATSNPEDDGLFAAALDRAGGFASLATFHQTTSPAGGINLPLPAFAKNATLVAVDVPVDARGVVHAYPHGMVDGATIYPSAGALMSGTMKDVSSALFDLDFGIDLDTIDRISAADLLTGPLDISRIAGKKVIIGASAAELRDLFITPRFGMIPGGLVHVLAAETLRQHRALTNPGPWPGVASLLLLALVAALLQAKLARPRYVAMTLLLGIVVEAAAYFLQSGPTALIVNTATVHIGLGCFVARGFALEVIERKRAEAVAARERDRMRLMLDRVVADNFDGIVVIDERGCVVAASHFAETVLGRHILGKQANEFLPAALEAAISDELGDRAASNRVIAGEAFVAVEWNRPTSRVWVYHVQSC